MIYPVEAITRNRQLVVLRGTIAIGPEFAPVRMLSGQTKENTVELWTSQGRYREDGTAHPLDIVGFQNPDGTLRPLTRELD